MEPSSDPHADAIPWERAAIEKLLFAGVRERRAERRWRIVKTLLWMLLIAGYGALLWALSGARLSGAAPSGPHTAVVAIRGVIADGNQASAANVLPAMREALENDGAQALVLLVNSPGGSPVQAGLISDEIVRLRKKHDKPIYVVVDEACASAAYYIAAAADRIYVNKASIVGSIGVLIDGFGFTGTMDKLGVERRLLTAGENKGFLDPFSPLSDAQRQRAQLMLDQIHRQFIAAVKQGRGERLKETPDTFSGLFWSGEQSLELGLADAYGSLDTVARDVVKAEKTIDYTNKGSVIDRLAKRLGAAMGAGAVDALGLTPRVR
jgi:protease-4